MKKRTVVVTLLLILVATSAWAGRQMSVQVRTAQVKASPSFTARSAGTVKYATRVDVMAEQNNWAHISKPNGWLHMSALTKKNIKPVSKKYTGSNLSYDEAALAGKGFNPQVEEEFKQSNRNLAAAYRDVDRVETFTASDSSLRLFAKTGKLNNN
jgi:hypothetical protein